MTHPCLCFENYIYSLLLVNLVMHDKFGKFILFYFIFWLYMFLRIYIILDIFIDSFRGKLNEKYLIKMSKIISYPYLKKKKNFHILKIIHIILFWYFILFYFFYLKSVWWVIWIKKLLKGIVSFDKRLHFMFLRKEDHSSYVSISMLWER